MILVGTSGYNYPEWKGSFYPSDLPTAKMLPFYATRFQTVEINYTFYRMPTPKLVAGWAAQVPENFRFTLKAPRRITHDRRLRAADVAEPLRGFIAAAAELGPRLGALLFQLPPNFKKDVGVLNEFLDAPATEDDVGVRVPPRFVALRRCLRGAEGARRGAVHRRQRDARDAGADDGGPCLLPIA